MEKRRETRQRVAVSEAQPRQQSLGLGRQRDGHLAAIRTLRVAADEAVTDKPVHQPDCAVMADAEPLGQRADGDALAAGK